MNKTRILTRGAMLTAIVGALILIDRQMGFFFQEIILMLLPLVIIVQGVEGKTQDAFLLSLSLLLVGYLLGNITTYVYMPVGIIVGLCCCYVIKKKGDSASFLFTSIVSFTICEILVTFLIAPLVGINLQEQIMAGSEMFNVFGEEFLKTINLKLILTYSYILSTVLVGFMEGFLIWSLGVFLLKRFKIYEFDKLNIFSLKLNHFENFLAVVFICLIPISLFFGFDGVKLYIGLTLGMLGLIGEAAFGILYIVVKRIGIEKKRLNPLLSIPAILFFPISMPIFSLIGVLYNQGTLYKKNVNKVVESYKNTQE